MKNRIIIFIIALVVTTICIFGVFFYKKGSKELILTAKTNGGVPFTWEYEIEDTSVVEFIKRDSYVEDKYKDLDGGPVNVTFTFKGIKEGTTTITLKYVDFRDNTISKTEKHKVKVDNNMNISLY